MTSNKDYIQECKLFLQAFENTQALMLEMKCESAALEFESEIEVLNQLVNEMHAFLCGKDQTNKSVFLLTRQIERVNVFFKEMRGLLINLKDGGQIESSQIIMIFERQHLFKNIFRKHLADFSKLSSEL